MSYISCDNITLGYEREKEIVAENLSFTVNKGDYLCIIGENGAGKSTLVKTILSLIRPMKGEIIYGDDLKNYEIGYLPQQTLVQRDFPASVWEIVLSGCLSGCGKRPFYNKQDKKKACDNMKRLSIWDIKDRCYRNLSGGQQQRVLLARALCATTKVLLLDEPATGLDPKVTAELYQLISKLNKEGITIIMVSHDISAATTYASHILHVGRDNSFMGTREEYLESDAWKNFSLAGGERSE